MSDPQDPVRAAAIVKMTFLLKKKSNKQFKSIYKDILKDLGVTGKAVDRYIDEHREELETLCKEQGTA